MKAGAPACHAEKMQSLGKLTLGENPPGNAFTSAGKTQIPGDRVRGRIPPIPQGFLRSSQGKDSFNSTGVSEHGMSWKQELAVAGWLGPHHGSLRKVGWWEVRDVCKRRVWSAVKYFYYYY